MLYFVICLLFVVYLCRLDARTSNASSALWIPTIWMFLAGSRYTSQWLNLGSPVVEGVYGDLEGSPVDGPVFFALIAAGAIVLLRRRLPWGRLLAQNVWLSAFFLYCVLSILWSDNPLVSSKRLFKNFGTVIMALVILSEGRPDAVVITILRRLAFLTLPMSVVFVRYLPELGRTYHMGIPLFTGVATHKSGLGNLCLLGGIYVGWSILVKGGEPLRLGGPFRIRVDWVFLALVAWLLSIANSATSFACLMIALCLLLLSRVPAMVRSPRRIMTLAMFSLVFGAVLNLTIVDLKTTAVESLNRDASLTTRVPMWEELLAIAPSPMLGSGYEGFWSSQAGFVMRARWEVFQAHNGYLEQYLNQGIVGLALLLACIAAGLFKIWRHLPIDFHWAVLRLCLVLVVAFFNWTEATFYGVSNMWLLLLIGLIEIPSIAPSGEVAPGTQLTRGHHLKRSA